MPVTINSNQKPSWLKSGKDSTQAYKQAAHNQQQAIAAGDRMRRFYMSAGEEKTVTFLDGMLDEDGMLGFMSFNEHTIQTGAKKWEEVVCLAEQEICPACTAGHKSYYVGVFTVINHTPYIIQSGPNAGKKLGDRRELYCAKLGTLRTLQTYAAKWGGLKGWKVEITRVTEKDAKVGNLFQKISHCDDLVSTFGPELSLPADYGKEINFLTAEQMVAAGLGTATTGPGFNKPQFADAAAAM
jgi:hypothetical protein